MIMIQYYMNFSVRKDQLVMEAKRENLENLENLENPVEKRRSLEDIDRLYYSIIYFLINLEKIY